MDSTTTALSFFGRPTLIIDGQAVEIKSRKGWAVLAYLALANGAQPQEEVGQFLWPELNVVRSLANLRRLWQELGETAVAPWLRIEGEKLALVITDPQVVDVLAFRQLLAGGELNAAVALYKGSFLADLYIGDSSRFEEWVNQQRQTFRFQLLQALETLTAQQIAVQAYEAAEPLARRQLEIEPAYENGHRQLMQILAQLDQRVAALAQYQICRQLLKDRLEVEPSPETVALYKQIEQELLASSPIEPLQNPNEGHVKGYELQNEIGKGAFGAVYQAVQPGVNRDVAVKIIRAQYASHPDFIQRFETEARVIAQLEHPHIVPLYDYWQSNEGAFLVMRWLRGGSLQERLEYGPMPPETVARMVDQIASALDAAHRYGVIHRDLKPANILLDEDDNAYLSDFGIAKNLGDDVGVTQVGQLVGTPSYAAPEQFTDDPISAVTDIYSLGILIFEMFTGKSPFAGESLSNLIHKQIHEPLPSLHERMPQLPEGVDAVIQRATAKEGDKRYQTAMELANDLRAAVFGNAVDVSITRVAAAPRLSPENLVNPYRGLFAFREEDAPFFFGREEMTDKLYVAAKRQSMVAVIGSSGSGKSSVVYAGLVAQVRQRENWTIAAFRPGQRPFYALAEALTPLLQPELSETDLLVEIQKLATALSNRFISLLDVIKRINHKRQTERVLLVADQFEELYTLSELAQERNQFLDVLLDLVFSQQYQLLPVFTLVLTLRADFLGQLLAHRPTADAIQDGDIKLGPMNRAELERVVASPAEKQHAAFETGLVARILDDVGDEPGNLPLLEFALTALWEKQLHGVLTHQAYESIGRVEGALARHADEVYVQLTAREQVQVRRIFIQMVRPGEGTEDTRRLATRSELGEADWPLISRLADARLVVTGRDPEGQETVEVVHEALIRSWGQLRSWMTEDRSFRVWQEQLRAAQRQWESTDRDDGALLRGVALATAESWLSTRKSDLSPSEVAFIEGSIGQRQAQVAQAEEERLAQERLRRRFTRALAAGFLLALAFAVVAVLQWVDASAARDRAVEQFARQLSAQALSQMGERYDMALLLALEAVNVADTAATNETLNRVLSFSPNMEQSWRLPISEDFTGGGLSRDGHLAAVGDPEFISIYDWNAGTVISYALDIPYDQGVAWGFSSTGQQLAVTGDGIHLIDTANGREAASWGGEILEQPAYVIFSPDDQYIGVIDGLHAYVWEIASQALLLDVPIVNDSELIPHMVFSPDSQLFAVSTVTGVQLWDVQTAAVVQSLSGGHVGAVIAVAFQPDGKLLATGSTDATIRLWDVASGALVGAPLLGHTGAVSNLAFQPTGQFLAAGDVEGNLFLWDLTATPPINRPLRGGITPISGLAFSEDGQTLISSRGTDTDFGRLEIVLNRWTVGGRVSPLAQLLNEHEGAVINLGFAADKRWLVSVDENLQVEGWDLFGQNEVPVEVDLSDLADAVWGRELSPNGQTMALATTDSTVLLVDLSAGGVRTPRQLADPSFPLVDVKFSADGRWLAGGGCRNASPDSAECNEGEAWVWELASGRATGPFVGHRGPILNVAVSSDGRWLVTASPADGIILWSVERQTAVWGPELGDVAYSNNITPSFAFSADSSLLAAGFDDGVRLWSLANGVLTEKEFDENLSQIMRVAISPDGRWLAGGMQNGLIALWDTADLALVSQLPQQHQSMILSLAYSPDGSELVSGSLDQNVIMWDMSVYLSGEEAARESIIDFICRIANRNLYPQEWERFFGEEVYRPTCVFDHGG